MAASIHGIVKASTLVAGISQYNISCFNVRIVIVVIIRGFFKYSIHNSTVLGYFVSWSKNGKMTDTTDCFKKIETQVGSGEIQNYTKSVQSFNSLIPTNNKITAINENIAGGSGPVTDMEGVWDLMKNQTMTRQDRQMVLDEVNILLDDAKPGFTKLQNDELSLCITTELNSLGPTLNY